MGQYPTYLIHYGVPGQKWGARRYQNTDGSLTPEGREHYGYGSERDNKKLFKQMSRGGKHTKVNEYGVAKNDPRTTRTYKKLAKNKVIQEALKDERFSKAQTKAFNTERKYYTPDADDVMYKVWNKKHFNPETASDEEWEKIRIETDKQYMKELKKFRELDKKDPSTIAMKDLDKETSRLADIIAAEYGDVKIGDITYKKHLERLIDYVGTQEYMHKTYGKNKKNK